YTYTYIHLLSYNTLSVFSYFASLTLCLFREFCLNISFFYHQMAHLSISKAMMVVMAVVLAMACDVAAQDSGLAPSPEPPLTVGAGFSLPVSVATIVFSLIFSLVALS
ncbi:hypothetical protein TorRG33x02_125060, partial [Trema orientale]